MSGTPASSQLAGLRILVVDDEPLVGMLVEDMLIDLGCQVVGPAPSVAEALRLVEAEGIAGALLDVNLGGELVYPVAEALRRRGVPFVFVTGYAGVGIAPAFAEATVLRKPLDLSRFEANLVEGLLGPGRTG